MAPEFKTSSKRLPFRLAASVCLIAAIFAASLPFARAAGDGVDTVRVGYYENEVFQEGAQPGAVKTGYAYEYYLKLSEYTGWRYEYIYGDYADLYQMLLDGEVDLLAGLARKEERVGLIGYPDAAMGNETLNLVKHDSDTDVTADPSTLAGKKIGVLESALTDVLAEYLAAHRARAEVVTFPDYEALFSAFDAHRVDILAAEGDGAYGRDHAEVLCAFGATDYYLCVSIARPDLLVELNAAQAQLLADEPDYLYSLRSKYYPVSVSSRAFSTAEREWLEAHGTLRVGYLKHYLPYSDADERGDATGIIRELVPKMLDDLGIGGLDVVYRGFESYDDMIVEMGADGIDAAFPVGGGLYYSEENGIYQSSPVASSSTELVFRGEYGEDTVSRFAANENNRMQYYYIRTNFPEAEIAFYPSIEDCLDAVLSGKAGCTTLNGLRANEILRNRRYSELSLRQLSQNDDRCFGVKIGNEGLLKLLNRGINVVGADYTRNLADRYMGGLYTYTFADMVRENGWLFGTILLLVAALVIFFLVRDSKRAKAGMLEQEKARRELEETNRELAESQEALSAALIAEEHANRAKSDFLSNMSHEIRTPITAILGMNEMIQRESGSDDVLEYSDTIQKAGESLLGIISDILDFSKIEAGHMELDAAEYQLSGLIGDSLNLTRLRAEDKGLSLRAEVDPSLPEHLIGDEIRVKQIVTNLLSNAVKYTEKGSVRLEVALEDREKDAVLLRVAVKDTGIGIRPEEMDKLFTAFDRLDASRTRTIEGTGLGLAITHKLLSMMGSELKVESVYGNGSTFSFILRQGVSSPEPIGAYDPDLSAGDGRPRRKSHSPFVAPEARVLVVDDTPMNLQVIRGLLKRTKMHIDTAESGAACIERFGAEDYDLVFLDYRMPEMDGIETLTKLGGLYPEKRARTPVVCLTASAIAGDRERMLSAGFTDYLTKPVNIEEMEATLVKYLPASKVSRAGGDGTDGDETGEDDPLKLLPAGLADIPALDPALGVRFCGGAEEYMDALAIFEKSIDERAGEIEMRADEADWNAYAIAVHSLKSTSRAIGALALSDLAKSLEAAGNAEDAETIRRDTPELLALYRSLRAPLRQLLASARENGANAAQARPPLSEAEFDDALTTARELAAAFDYDSLTMVMEMLAGGAAPESRAAVYEKLRSAVDRCDWDAIGAALDEAGAQQEQ